ncbi:glycosyltransferase family 4 protein [Psychroflexus sp. CAK1W]|uniref:glycosyltransferase family 4 protein n=1 Tax=Psychroflexus curvus TaxID=2873595 RepID=UPI001CCF6A56|nr:glycosyltransferase family 4 protein [Psychroflexus curvus]MBZ9628153.1 glycosyltransferase family 4 protein [Psychroflexus curvus]
MNYIKPIIISRTLPYLGGREIMVQKIIEYYTNKNGVIVISPDNFVEIEGSSFLKYNENVEDEIISTLKNNTFNIVNCHTFYLSEFAFKVAKELNIPLVFTLHGVFTKFYDLDYSKLLKTIYKKSHSTVTVSNNYFGTLSNLFGDASKLKYITNGIDLNVSINLLTNNAIREAFNSSNKYLIIVPARLNPIKGLDYLIASTKYLDDVIKIIIASPKGRKNEKEKNYKKELLNTLERLGKQNIISFLEFDNSEVYTLFKKSDLVLLPSLIEGVSIALLEALSIGCLVAASNVGGNSQVINHLKNGYLFESENEFEIASIINEIRLTEKSDLNNVRQNAKKTIEAKYSLDTMLLEYQEHFENILEEASL